MEIKDFQKLIINISEDDIEFDDPHVTKRCKENNITKEIIVKYLLHDVNKLSKIIEDRPKVYKLYFKISGKRQLKLIIDLFKYEKIMVRTVKILNPKLFKKIKLVKRRR
ncbi:hypothetical protein CL617_02990 [archaeon]|nr:hypothetical protein [archaeon]|tara:strand:- start:11568 stop:11894 length:327 start_codon:yes stop_codon:yes gene_type:complete